MLEKSLKNLGAVGLEPTNPEGEGFTVPCNCHYATPPKKLGLLFVIVTPLLTVGIEPTTVRLQVGCSTN
jgi:hypothetical protein